MSDESGQTGVEETSDTADFWVVNPPHAAGFPTIPVHTPVVGVKVLQLVAKQEPDSSGFRTLVCPSAGSSECENCFFQTKNQVQM